MNDTLSGPRPVVAVWRNRWLGRSETFIANQIGALSRWRSVHVGREWLADGLPLRLDCLLKKPGRLETWVDRQWGWSPSQVRFTRFVRNTGTVLLHAHFGNNGTTALPYARRNGLPLVVTFHGFDVGKGLEGDGLEAVRRREALSRVFSYATVLIAVSDFIGGRLRSLGAPAEKILVHRIGIPHHPLLPAGQPRSGVIFVGRLVQKKGVDDLFRAYASLAGGLREQHSLSVVGDGPERAPLEALAQELGLAPRWLGWKAPAEVMPLLDGAAVFCGPSKTTASGDVEGLGMVFLEAQSRGVPVVSYRHGGVPEAIEEGVTGLMAEEGDVRGLAGALTKLLSSPLLRDEFGRRGAAWVRERYDIARQTDLLEAIYDRAVRR